MVEHSPKILASEKKATSPYFPTYHSVPEPYKLYTDETQQGKITTKQQKSSQPQNDQRKLKRSNKDGS